MTDLTRALGLPSPTTGSDYCTSPAPSRTPRQMAESIGRRHDQELPKTTAEGLLCAHLDVYADSVEADRKRKPNAAASARFRSRKKKKDMEREAKIQALEKENRKLLALVDHYRSEYDRLRDLVSRTPGVSEHVDGLQTIHPIATPPCPTADPSLDPSPDYPQQHRTRSNPNPEFHIADFTPSWNRQTTLPSLAEMVAGIGPYGEAAGEMEAMD